jgi:hypothetical protein
MRQVDAKCQPKTDCKGSCKCEPEDTENLIILDEEQEDEDDVDV